MEIGAVFDLERLVGPEHRDHDGPVSVVVVEELLTDAELVGIIDEGLRHRTQWWRLLTRWRLKRWLAVGRAISGERNPGGLAPRRLRSRLNGGDAYLQTRLRRFCFSSKAEETTAVLSALSNP